MPLPLFRYARAIAANTTLSLLGDSRPARVNFSSQFINANGFPAWFRRNLFGQADFNKANDFAVAGYTTQQVVDNTLASCAASSAGSVLILVGINDIGAGMTLTQTNANLDTIVSTMHAAGKVVFICDELPTNDVDGSPTAIYHAGIRDHIRTFNNPGSLIFVLPSWNSIAVSPDSNAAVAGSYPDTPGDIHPTSVAGNAIVMASLSIVSGALPRTNLFTRPGVLYGGDFNTAGGGTASGGVIGTVPSGWTANLNSGTGAIACSMVQEDGLNWMQAAITGGTATEFTFYTGSLISGFTPGTSYIDMLIRCRVTAGVTGFSRLRLVSLRDGGTAVPCANGDPAYDSGNQATDLVPTTGLDLLLWLPHVLVPADATSINQRIEFKANVGVSCSGTIKFAIPQVRIYTGSLTD